MSRLKQPSPSVAHALPLVVFLAINALVPLFKVENDMLPWWQYAPEHWLYPLQTVIVGTLIIWCWRHYDFKPIKGLFLATVFGAIGIAFWLLPAFVYIKLTNQGIDVPEWASWFGLEAREKGFTPQVFDGNTNAQIHTLIWRFFRMAVIVPFAEEIFWRGFLTRYVQADGDDFRKVPFGKHTWKAYGIVTACFMLAHNPSDWLGAICFGSLMYLLAIKTKSLAACVWMHAVANLLLGIYVLWTRQWGFW